MATSTEQINDLIQAGNDWKEQADALIADRLVHQQAYQTLSGNLRGVVTTEMNFVAHIDPDEANPTKVRGGTFNTVAEAIGASPFGSLVSLRLTSGKTHYLDNVINVQNRRVLFSRDGNGDGDDPIIQVNPLVWDGENIARMFLSSGGAGVTFTNMDVRLPTAKADNALPWGAKSLFEAAATQTITVGFIRTRISGGVAGEGFGVMAARWASQAQVGFYDCTIDGPISGVTSASLGLALIKKVSLTLLNGATLTDDSTIGTNILQN